MIAEAIAFTLQNLPAILLVIALAVPTLTPGRGFWADRYLAWMLLLPIGITGLWAGAFHVFLPEMSARYIGWQASPFQFEVGMADFAFGLAACIAFWRDLSFKEAVVIVASVFLLGDAIGHVRQMTAANNFAPGNAGVPFYTDIICPALAIAFLVIARRARRETSARQP